MSQEQRQQATHEEKLVPSTERVKISATNMRIEPTVPQKEETFQVVLDIIKASPCFKDFTIITDVPEIYMRDILDICPRVPNEDFVTPPSEEDLPAFHIELGYKGPLDHLVKMFVDHMHQPWRTLATIINRCLFGKTSSNDRLRQSRVAILWGMFYRKNVDFPKLIWEDFAYQIDYRQAKLRRSEIMPYLRFTKIIINHFLLLNPSIPKGPSSSIHTIKDDGLIRRLKFVRIGKDFQEYGRAIPETMVTEGIKKSEAYRTFVKYSTVLIPPKKSRGKGSEGKKSVVTLKPISVKVSDESDPEPAKRQTESDLEPARSTRKRSSGITFKDISSASKKKSPDKSQKRKGIQTLIVEEQLATDTMQALKASKRSSKNKPHIRGSSEEPGVTPGVLDESTVILTTSSEGTGTKPRVPDELKGSSEVKGDFAIDWGSKEESEYSEEENVDEEIEWLTTHEEEEKKDDDENDRSINMEKTNDDEETDDEFVHGDEYVHDDVDEEMKDDEDAETGKDDEEIIDAEKIEVTKGDLEQARKLPQQAPVYLCHPVLVILEPTVLSPIHEIPLVTPATTPPPPPFVSTITPVLQQTTIPIPTPPITIVAPAATTVPDPLPIIAHIVSVLENVRNTKFLGKCRSLL
ncbi:hypothetical protein Tco_1122770 [Tanacetum coccineum]|uniref:Uncharacterized protein n=1 Tax=Tanacetum coccineum TaxID=301880 RepID=A0ABQ5J2T7_9ASTR